jgi:hypothetical protein
MGDVSQANIGIPTIHTVIMDTASMELYLYTPPDAQTEAVENDPIIVDFESVFERP